MLQLRHKINTPQRGVFILWIGGADENPCSTTSRFDQCNAVKSSRLPRSRCVSIVRGNPSPSARNITHPMVIPRDVLFCPVSGGFIARYYQCISSVLPNPPKLPTTIYLAQKCGAVCIDFSCDYDKIIRITRGFLCLLIC